jgi:hypothetical protein
MVRSRDVGRQVKWNSRSMRRTEEENEGCSIQKRRIKHVKANIK